MLQDLNFKNKTALIMGASRGIGKATAEVFAAYGAHVVLAARRLASVRSVADAICESGGCAQAVTCDVSKFDSVKNCVESVVEEHQHIDFLINNAGVIEPQAKLIESDVEAWQTAININVMGVYHCLRAAVPAMLSNPDGGAVVNMSSGAATSALVGWSHYCASKAAVKKLTEVLHKELDGSNVYVVGLSPGTVATDMMQQIRKADINPVSKLDWSQHIPPDWPAQAVAFLCGPEGKEFAGTDFSIKTKQGRQRVGLPIDGASD